MIKSYGQVIRDTLDEELSRDNSIFLIGEDIGTYGGCFGITKGLLDKYGHNRVIDSPMSEQAIVGLGIGAALNGLRPIVEIMFMDFVTLIYDQLFNHASIFNYLSNGKVNVPLVIRIPAGGGRGYGATHSKTLIAPLMNIPGIKIVAPSNAGEVRGLLKASIKDNNPVIFVEHKSLYNVKGDFEDLPDLIPLGKARIIKEGNDVVLISFSKTVNDCIKVAEELESEGVSCEVIDLRTIKPLDMDLIKKSVEKIGRVVIVEEGYSECGVASEIIARINDEFFNALKAPVKRVTSLNVPISCCPEYETVTIPSPEKIEEAILGVLDE